MILALGSLFHQQELRRVLGHGDARLYRGRSIADAQAGLLQGCFEGRPRLAAADSWSEVAPGQRDRRALAGEGRRLAGQLPRGAAHIVSGRRARNEDQERGENRVPPLHGCDHSTSRFSPPVTIRITPRRQLRATKNDTGNVIAAISTQPTTLAIELARAAKSLLVKTLLRR
jgi:hypothetical protein